MNKSKIKKVWEFLQGDRHLVGILWAIIFPIVCIGACFLGWYIGKYAFFLFSFLGPFAGFMFIMVLFLSVIGYQIGISNFEKNKD